MALFCLSEGISKRKGKGERTEGETNHSKHMQPCPSVSQSVVLYGVAAALNCSRGDVMRRFAAAFFSFVSFSLPPLYLSLPETATSCNLDIVKGRNEKDSGGTISPVQF